MIITGILRNLINMFGQCCGAATFLGGPRMSEVPKATRLQPNLGRLWLPATKRRLQTKMVALTPHTKDLKFVILSPEQVNY